MPGPGAGRAAAARRRHAGGAERAGRRRPRPLRRRRSPPSPAASARPAPRRCCGCCWRRSGRRHAAIASYNNHWGVPLTLARMPAGSAFAVIEIGMNNPGEIVPLARLAAPACRRRHHDRRGAYRPYAAGWRRWPRRRAASPRGLVPGGTAVLPRDSAILDRLLAIARAAGAGRIIGFGRDRAAEIRLAEASILRDGRTRGDGRRSAAGWSRCTMPRHGPAPCRECLLRPGAGRGARARTPAAPRRRWRPMRRASAVARRARSRSPAAPPC